jgi:hypothetical protein
MLLRLLREGRSLTVGSAVGRLITREIAVVIVLITSEGVRRPVSMVLRRAA